MGFVNKIIFLTLISFIQIIAQDDLEEQFEIAENLFNNKNYFDAVTEYKRLLFFDESNQYKYEANYKIGVSLKEAAFLDEAISYFTTAEISAKNPEHIFESRLMIVRSNILRRTTERALKILDSLLADKRFVDSQNKIHYWKGWAYIFADDWENASREFAQCGFNGLYELCMETDNNKYSVEFAKYSSYLIPGFGQFYTGEYLSGIISLGWNVLFGYLTINAFIEDRAFDGFVIGSLLWLRFYRGNFYNAEKFAVEKNIEISNKTLNFLQYEFKGEKP